jgi:hypothetical protein
MCTFVVAFNHGRQARAEAEQAQAVASEQENHTFCINLGLAAEGYLRCVTGLGDIRRLQQQRWEADAIGVL